MDWFDWTMFLALIVGTIVYIHTLGELFERWMADRRDQRMIKAIRVKFPEALDITVISVSRTDREGVKEIRKEIERMP